MAITQISQITHRLGLNTDLPQLAGAELGWSTDTRQLYIGNGALSEGAPVVGNTEVLTEFSDILNLAKGYNYKGAAAGYTPQTGVNGTTTTERLQDRLDQWVSVKDFGARGDGLTDDTVAINLALYQIYCRAANVQTRKALYFPAGVYRVTSSIKIPAYATLYGEGKISSIIQLDHGTTATCVAETADSLQQTQGNIGANSAHPPVNITVMNLAFQTLDSTKPVFVIQSANTCRFVGVTFQGVETTSSITSEAATCVGVDFGTALSLTTQDIVFDSCSFLNLAYAINTDQNIRGVVINNSKFHTLFRGIALGQTAPIAGGPTGVRITNNVFDVIYAEAILMGAVSLNASGHNVFYDVGNLFAGITNSTGTNIISIGGNNNVSIGDMFQRPDNLAATAPRINLQGTTSIAITNGVELSMGTKTSASGVHAVLVDNKTRQSLFTVANKRCKIDYSIDRGSDCRTGTLWIASNGVVIDFMDDYSETANLKIVLSAAPAVNNTAATDIAYTTTPSTGVNAVLNYSVSYFAGGPSDVPPPAPTVVSTTTHCVGTDLWATDHMNDGSTQERLIEANSAQCGYTPPPLTVIRTTTHCVGPDLWATDDMSDNSTQERLVETNSSQCYPQPVSIYTECRPGYELWQVQTMSYGPPIETLLEENSTQCGYVDPGDGGI